jgi:hypothetical protein
MRCIAKVLWLLGIMLLAVPYAVSTSAARDKASSIVIYFKDGHQQSFPLADIARIEFSAPSESSFRMERGHFVGKWKVGDGAGGTFLITLRRDGTATKTLGSAHGTWTVVNGEARISWNDGWHDVIRRNGGGFQKAAYAPGRSYTQSPSNVAEAEPTEPI